MAEKIEVTSPTQETRTEVLKLCTCATRDTIYINLKYKHYVNNTTGINKFNVMLPDHVVVASYWGAVIY